MPNKTYAQLTEVTAIDDADLFALYPTGGPLKRFVASVFFTFLKDSASGFLRRDGSNTMTGQVQGDAAGDAASPAFGFDGDNDTGLFRKAANVLGFASGGAERMALGEDGLTMASGDGISFGNEFLKDYDEGTWTPTIDYTTPGTSSTVYSDQTGTYVRIGRLVLVIFQVVFTPTLGTASGVIQVNGLPITAAATGNQVGAGPRTVNSAFSMPGGFSQYGLGLVGTSALGLYVFGSAASSGGIGPANMTSGAVHSLGGSLLYRAA
jgi:hypothetical protein